MTRTRGWMSRQRRRRRQQTGLGRVGWLVALLVVTAAALTGAVLWLGSAEVRRLFHSPRERARLLLKTRNYDEAMRYFKQALESEPHDAFSLRGMARCYVGKGDLKAAAAYAEEAVQRDPGPRAHLLRGEIALKAAGAWEPLPELQHELTDHARRHLETAAQHARAAIAMDPTYGPPHRVLAEATARLGDMAGAMEHIERAIEVDPTSKLTRLVAADLLCRQGKLQAALEHNRYLLDELDPDHLGGLRQGVDILLALERFDEAIARCERLRGRVDPATFYLELAVCRLGKGEYREAEKLASRAEAKLSSETTLPTLYWVRGMARLHQRKFGLAVFDFRNLATHQEQDGRVYFRLGQAYAGSGEKELAGDALRQAFRIEPRLFAARLALGRLQADAGHLTEALACLREGLVALRDHPGAYRQACEDMVEFCTARGRPDLAEAELRRLLAMEPQSVGVAVLLCTLYLDRGDGEHALPVAQHLVRLRPQDPKALHLLGRAEAVTGNRDLAAAHFAQAVRRDPTYRPAYLAWAQMRADEGSTAAAEDVYQRALRALGGAPDLRVARARFLMASGHREEAKAELRGVIAENSDELSARAALVDCLLAGGLHDAALQQARAATQAMPESGAAHSLLARVHRARGEWETLLVVLRRVAEDLDPGAFIGYQRLVANVHQRRYKAAVAVGEAALERFPDRGHRIRIELAIVRFLAGERQRAMEDVAGLLGDRARDADAGIVLSLLRLIDTGQAARSPACHHEALPDAARAAWSDLARLTDTRPTDARRAARALLEAFLYANAGWHNVAAERCRHVLTIAPGSLWAHRLLPLLYERAGQRQKALAAARAGCGSRPGSHDQRELLGDLL
ncbi:MAG: tetratricopeptide repeat protein, partial [bacterium]